MPRKYQPKAGARKYGSCDSSKLQQARDKIAAGESQRSVCNQLGITRSTLQNKLKEKHQKKPGRPTILSEKEEIAIAEHLVATAEWGFPFDGLDIMMLVKNYLAKRGRTVQQFKDNTPGPDWLESYLKRHSGISKQ